MANEYLSLQRFPGDGVTTDFSVSFAGGTPDAGQGTEPYVDVLDVKAYEIVPGSGTNPPQRIPRDVEVLGPLTFRIAPAVAVGRILEIARETENRNNLVDFKALQTVSEFDLDLATRQLLFVTQETLDRAHLSEETAEVSRQTSAEALIVAEDARGIANAADGKAEDAMQVAAQARSTANSANTTAGNANATAGNALATAQQAVNTAGAASTKADQAVNTANAATTTAGQAVNTANAATATANQASTRATQALDTANTALTASEAAEESAADAWNGVYILQDAVIQFGQIANDARNTANTAQSVANAIDGKATEALSTANSAYAIAEEAMGAVQDAGVASFNGRAGIVTPMAGDYSAAMVTIGNTNVEVAYDYLSNVVSALNDSKASLEDVQEWWGNSSYKLKLDTVEEGAQKNVATDLSHTLGTQAVTISSSTGEDTVIPAASTTAAGVMTSADRVAINSLGAASKLGVGADPLSRGDIALKPGSFGTGDPIVLPSGTNLDDVTTPGFYRWTLGVEAPRTYASMLVTKWGTPGEGFCEQMLFKNDLVFVRGKNNAATPWTPWRLTITDRNFRLSGTTLYITTTEANP